MRQSIVLDLDGIICDDGPVGLCPPWTYGQRKPKLGIEDKLRKMSEKYTIIIYTSRQSNDSFWTTITWLQFYGLDKYISQVIFDKPFGVAYIDNKAASGFFIYELLRFFRRRR